MAIRGFSSSQDLNVSEEKLSSRSLMPSIVVPLIGGVAAIVLSLGSFIAWSCIATISSAVIVPGKVIVDGGAKYVQHPTGGVIKSIDVKEGQQVTAGETLLSLDPSVLDVDLYSLRRLTAINIADKARLRAERDGLSHITFKETLDGLDERAWKLIIDEQIRLFEARRTALTNKIQTLRSDYEEAMSVVKTIDYEMQEQALRVQLTEQELATASLMARKGYGTRQRVLETERALAELQSDLANLISRRMDANQSAKHDMLEEKQENANFLQEVASDLQSAEKEDTGLSLKIKTVEQQRAALRIRSPVSGQVVNLSVHTVGGVIMAGDTLMEIVPVGTALSVEAEVRPDDINGIVLGLPVNIRLSGPQNENSPRIVGKINLVSADRISDLRHDHSFFRVRAEINQSNTAASDLGKIEPGFGVTMMIRHGDHTPLNYLLSPLLNFFKRSLH